jgi:hypothetical protein
MRRHPNLTIAIGSVAAGAVAIPSAYVAGRISGERQREQLERQYIQHPETMGSGMSLEFRMPRTPNVQVTATELAERIADEPADIPNIVSQVGAQVGSNILKRPEVIHVYTGFIDPAVVEQADAAAATR